MFGKKDPTLLDLMIADAIKSLKHHTILSEEYARTLAIIERLHKMKEAEKPSSVSKDTLAVVGANLLGILMIIKHEHINVITSRAMNLIMKPRI